ncbi:MAG TPA: tetratricopeptide repeat protein, partial [Fibrobacteria bacterium]|nr:tetratricopeptide repeat protein [Fibrobacteria bacterium]
EGSDIADRLDEIFAGQERNPAVSAPPDSGSPAAGQVLHDEAGDATDTSAIDAGATRWSPLPAPEVPEVPEVPSDELAPDDVTLFAEEPASVLPPLEPTLADPVVSGEDISSRLSEIFDTPATGAETTSQSIVEEEPAPGTLSEVDSPVAPVASRALGTEAPEASRPADPPLTRMHDEEESFPEEEENTLQSAAGANVATVTLAEIYFQQGLREQALQIYRQLLEREPGNDSVRKRIQEIEASKPETGDPGQGQDSRRPRPGLKVPKRKK